MNGFDWISSLGIAAVLTTLVAVARAASLGGLTLGFLHAAWFARAGGTPMLAGFGMLVGLGTLASRIGREQKEQFGVAETRGGQRGARNVLANAGAAALLLTVGAMRSEFAATAAVAAAAALAGSLADTVAGELGMLTRVTPRLLLFGTIVRRGENGGMTWGGLGFAVAAAALSGAVWAFLGGAWLPVVAGGLGGAVLDSVLGATLERRGLLGNEGVNFGASLGAGLIGAVLA